MTDIIKLLISTNATVMVEILIFPIIIICALRKVSHGCKQLIANRYGVRGQVLFGSLGIFIHELSHMIVAILFGHKITGVRLIHVPRGAEDNKLGYVNHSFNPKSGYQRFGNLMIGIAPIFGCTAILFIATWLLEPALLNSLSTLPNWSFPISILSISSIWKLLALILVASSIAIGGFDLSADDLSNIKFGLFILLILIIVVSSFATLLGVAPIYLNWMHTTSMIINGVLCLSLIVTVLSNGLIRLITNH